MSAFLSPSLNSYRKSVENREISSIDSILNFSGLLRKEEDQDEFELSKSRYRSPASGLPLSINKIYRRMYANGFGYSSSPSAVDGQSGGVIIRQYLIPRNENCRLVQLYKQKSQSSSPISIPNSSDSSFEPSGKQRNSYLIPLFGKSPGMGAFLDKPRTEKSNDCGHGAGLRYGIAAMQGWRIEMEDAHTARAGTDLPAPWNDWAFFAVFDGHAGCKVARYCSSNLLEAIWQTDEMQTLAKELPLARLEQKHIDAVLKAMKHGFLSLDERMRQYPDLHSEQERSGSTAVCAVVAPSHIFVGNLGDSRALISRNGQVHFATEDHKPYNPKERDRIVNAGGSVMIQRVNGSLAVSRALGDYEYKSVPGFGPCQQLVSPEPDIHVVERDLLQQGDGRDEFLLLACDGVFDVMNNHELCDFVRSRLRVTDRLELICNQILDSCLSKGSKDNMSVILVTFPGAPQVSNEAVDNERALEERLRERIHGIVTLCDSEMDREDVDADYVLRTLMNQEIPGVPPGAGLHAMRHQVETILESILNSSSKNSPGNVRREAPESPVPSSPGSGEGSDTPPPDKGAQVTASSSGTPSPASSRAESPPAVAKVVTNLAASPSRDDDSQQATATTTSPEKV